MATFMTADTGEVFEIYVHLSGYPQQPPTAMPWDLGLDSCLAADARPKGCRAEHVFRADWEHGKALYAPWDRVALTGHPDWPRQHPEDVWHPGRDIAFLLGRVHELLNAEDYAGA